MYDHMKNLLLYFCFFFFLPLHSIFFVVFVKLVMASFNRINQRHKLNDYLWRAIFLNKDINNCLNINDYTSKGMYFYLRIRARKKMNTFISHDEKRNLICITYRIHTFIYILKIKNVIIILILQKPKVNEIKTSP